MQQLGNIQVKSRCLARRTTLKNERQATSIHFHKTSVNLKNHHRCDQL